MYYVFPNAAVWCPALSASVFGHTIVQGIIVVDATVTQGRGVLPVFWSIVSAGVGLSAVGCAWRGSTAFRSLA